MRRRIRTRQEYWRLVIWAGNRLMTPGRPGDPNSLSARVIREVHRRLREVRR